MIIVMAGIRAKKRSGYRPSPVMMDLLSRQIKGNFRITVAADCVAIIAFFARLKAAVAAIGDAGAGFKRAIRGARDSSSGAAFVCR